MQKEPSERTLTFQLEGRLDASNAGALEEELTAALERSRPSHVVLDAGRLAYISSAGLRVVTRLLRCGVSVTLTDVTPAVYEVLDMTGLTEMAEVRKRLREVSVDGLKQIGAGAFGRVYRLDGERVIKVYTGAAASLERIEGERQAARQAFVHGIPSAIPFDTVCVEDGYGSIYELIDARTVGQAAAGDPAHVDDYARRTAALLRQLHQTRFEEGSLPDARGIFQGWIDVAEASGLYEATTIAALRAQVDAIPPRDTFVHGDFHPANIMVMPDGELMLIDMGDASMGDPVIDLAGTYHVLRVAARRPGGAERLTGMSSDLLDRFWATFVRAYYETDDAAQVEAIERRLALAAMPRTMGSNARSKLIDDDERRRVARELERAFQAGRPSGSA